MMNLTDLPIFQNQEPLCELASAAEDMARLHNLLAFLYEVSPLLNDPEEFGECALDGFRQTLEMSRQYAQSLGEQLNALHDYIQSQGKPSADVVAA